MIVHQTHNSLGNYSYNAFIYDDCEWFYHFHKNYELLYTVAGSCQAVVASRRLTIEQGQFLLIPPYAIHGFTMDSNCKLWVCVFSSDHVGGQNTSIMHALFTCREDIQQFLQQNLMRS